MTLPFRGPKMNKARRRKKMPQRGGLVRLVGPGGGSGAMQRMIVLLLLGGARAQGDYSSCVQVSSTSFVPSCPCEEGGDFTFTMRGETTVEANVVR